MKTERIQGTSYQLITGYQGNDALRASFHRLTQAVFGFDFEAWYLSGYWREDYIPYTLFDGGKAISNVSISHMRFSIEGQEKHYIQLGTVMTHPDYRGKGICRLLMERVLKEWETACDGIYLYANETVLDFYPKFGFAPAKETQYSRTFSGEPAGCARKLDSSCPADLALLEQSIANARPYSNVHQENALCLTMFYALTFERENLYYIDSLKAAAVASQMDGTLFLSGVFSPCPDHLEELLAALCTKETKRVVLGFTPFDTTSYQASPLQEADNTLFFRPANLLPEGVMFPVLSHT